MEAGRGGLVPSGEAARLHKMRRNLEVRDQLRRHIRRFFYDRHFMEVDTPLLTPEIAPESEVIPYQAQGCFLITSPELCLKRLLAAGYERIFQISHVFRKGELGRLHHPEFSLLEWYRTGAGYRDVIADVEQLVMYLSLSLGKGTKLAYHGKEIDLCPPWPRISLPQAFRRLAGWDPLENPDPERFNDDLADLIIPNIDPTRPAVLLDYPSFQASLARLRADDPRLAERAEVIIGGLEVANAYSELNDPVEQERRFQLEREILAARGMDIKLPEHFLQALAHLPQCGGAALGIDRLLMLFIDSTSIDEVMPFTLHSL